MITHSDAAMPLRDRANATTPSPDPHWLQMPVVERIQQLEAVLSDHEEISDIFEVLDARADGQIIVQFLRPFSLRKRGGILLDLEDILKSTVDSSLTVWLEPLGDRNALRKLRGMEVK